VIKVTAPATPEISLNSDNNNKFEDIGVAKIDAVVMEVAYMNAFRPPNFRSIGDASIAPKRYPKAFKVFITPAVVKDHERADFISGSTSAYANRASPRAMAGPNASPSAVKYVLVWSFLAKFDRTMISFD
jgi:hypothetical protein